MGMQCRHFNALPDARILLHVTDKQIEEGFTYFKVRYPGIKFRVYRCERCNGMMEEAIPDLSYPMGVKIRHDLFAEWNKLAAYDRQRVMDHLVITTSHDGRKEDNNDGQAN